MKHPSGHVLVLLGILPPPCILTKYELLKNFPSSFVSLGHARRAIRHGLIRSKSSEGLDAGQLWDQELFLAARVEGRKLQNHKLEVKLWRKNPSDNIIFEDHFMAVIHKPAGVPISGSSGVNPAVSLHTWVKHHLKPSKLEDTTGSRRDLWTPSRLPRYCHRIDLDTEGLVVCSKTTESHIIISNQFEERAVLKLYLLVLPIPLAQLPIQTHPPNEFVADYCIDGKASRTVFKVVGVKPDNVLIQARPETGRKHQIRKHVKMYFGCSILGDSRYGRDKHSDRPLNLLAWKLELNHPKSSALMTFQVEKPNWVKNFTPVPETNCVSGGCETRF